MNNENLNKDQIEFLESDEVVNKGTEVLNNTMVQNIPKTSININENQDINIPDELHPYRNLSDGDLAVQQQRMDAELARRNAYGNDSVSAAFESQNEEAIVSPEESFSNGGITKDTREALLQLEDEGYTPDEIKEALTPDEEEAYQNMRENRAEDLAARNIAANTVDPDVSIQDIINQNTGLDRENAESIVIPETTVFNENNDLGLPPKDEPRISKEEIEKSKNNFYNAVDDFNRFFEGLNNDNVGDDSSSASDNTEGIDDSNEVERDFNINLDGLDTITANKINNAEEISYIEREIKRRESEEALEKVVNEDYQLENETKEQAFKRLMEFDYDANKYEIRYNGADGELSDDNTILPIQIIEKHVVSNNMSDEELASNIAGLAKNIEYIDNYNNNIEIDKKVAVLNEQLETIEKNKYKLMSDDELNALYNKFNDQYNYSVHLENGEVANNDSFIKDFSAVKAEKELRDKRPYSRYSDTELNDLKTKLEQDISKVWNISDNTQGENKNDEYQNMINTKNLVDAELQIRQDPEYTPEVIDIYSKSDDEIRREIADLEANKKEVGEVDITKKDEYAKELDNLKNEQVRRKFIGKTDEELKQELKKAKQADGMHRFAVNGKDVKGKFNFKKIQLSDGDYVSEQELMEAIEREFENLGPNEVVVSKKTGEKVDVKDLEEAIIEAAKQDSILELSGAKPKVKTHDIRAKDALNPELEFVSPGNGGNKRFQVPKDAPVNGTDDIPDDRYIRKNIAEDILNDLKVTTEPNEDVNDLKLNDDDIRKRIRDMLDKYYGEENKEKRYREDLKKYKSHIVTGEDGITRVEDFEGRADLEWRLQLEDFGYKIESLSMLEHDDENVRAEGLSRYYTMVDVMDDMNYPFSKKEDGTELTKEEKAKLLIANDENYVKTYNNAYNQHLATFTHLKTLGKHGEKAPYAKIEAVKDANGKIQPKVVLTNVGKCVMNTFIFGRNNIKAPINKVIGTYVVAKVHNLLYNAEENTAGLYKNSRSHRYAARRDYFEQEYLQQFFEKNEELREQGLPEKVFGLSDFIKMTNYARYHAVKDYELGNEKVLSAGAKNIEDAAYERAWLEAKSKILNKKWKKELSDLKKQAETIMNKIGSIDDEIQKKGLQEDLKKVNDKIKEVNTKMSVPITGLKKTQTDAISMAQHYRANKDNVTHVVTGIKTAARMAIGLGIKGHSERLVPEQTITHSHEQITPEGLKNMTIGDWLKASKGDKVTYHAEGGRAVSKMDEYVRGISYKGYSGTDGVGYNVFPTNSPRISTVQLDAPINEKSNLFDTIASVMSKAKVENVSVDALVNEAYKSGDPLGFISSKLRLWTSPYSSGMARGWVGDMAPTDELTKAASTLVKTVETIPADTKLVTETVEKLNPAVVAAYGALGAGEAADIYDEVRRTNTKEEMIRKGLDKGPAEEHEKETKAPYKMRNPEGENPYGFVGNRDGDYASIYNEADIKEQAEEQVSNDLDNEQNSNEPQEEQQNLPEREPRVATQEEMEAFAEAQVEREANSNNQSGEKGRGK